MDVVSMIGEGKAAQGRGTDYSQSIFKLASLQNKKPKEDKLIQPVDWHVDSEKFLPVYTTQIIGIMSKAANRINDLSKQLGSYNAGLNYFNQNEKFQYQQMINGVRAYNAEATKYVNTPAKDVIDPNRERVVAALYNPNISADDFAKLNDSENGIAATRDYGFASQLTPKIDYRKEVQSRWDKPELKDEVSRKTEFLEGNQQREVITHKPSQKAREDAVNYLVGNGDVLKNLIYENKQFVDEDTRKKLESADGVERTDAQRKVAGDVVDNLLSGTTRTAAKFREKLAEADKERSRMGWVGGDFSNERYKAKKANDNEYAGSYLDSAEGHTKEMWGASHALDDEGKKIDGFRSGYGVISGAKVMKNPSTGKDEWYVKITEAGNIVHKSTGYKKTETSKTDPTTYYIPYKEVSAYAETKTADKKGNKGFTIPQSEIDRVEGGKKYKIGNVEKSESELLQLTNPVTKKKFTQKDIEEGIKKGWLK